MNDILSLFPLAKPRTSQISVIKAIEKAYQDGYKNVLLEAPVGSGKSAIAITIAKHFGEAHILTPMKSLQDQYLDDFKEEEELVLMKGRAAYPCVYEEPTSHKIIVEAIKQGDRVPPGSISCAVGPCIYSSGVKEDCAKNVGTCPYTVAIETAQKKDFVIHNLHSFIFQAYFANRFQERKILIIDECHRIEDTIRSFASKSISIPFLIPGADLLTKRGIKTLDEWSSVLGIYSEKFDDFKDGHGISDRDRFFSLLESLSSLSDKIGEDFVAHVTTDIPSRRTKFEFIPERVSELTNKLLLDFGSKTLLMSGTIYNKSLFCRNVGLKEEETCFIRIGTSFPLSSRPIYMKSSYMVDTSHKNWDVNYPKMIASIRHIMSVFKDVKGLIHTPSYKASQLIEISLKDTGRIRSHTSETFQSSLQEFYSSTEPVIFLSPICQQGVDFKYERARFQIVIRVPYPNAGDPFVARKVEKDYPWFNYQALVAFGQQIGRVNRAEDDFGVTVLLDERFKAFTNKNRNLLPNWVKEGIIE